MTSAEVSKQNTFNPFFPALARTWTIVLCFGMVGFLAPMIYGLYYGLPVPHISDEFSYALAADTYASGRLTNPTPAHFEHFETLHVLMEPSYISKYPPLQGMFMAVGQVVFGHQIFGVWLSCGLFAGALFWMLSVWTTREWAILGTIAMIALIGINSYWAQSFWGGMIAASGGALFLGGFRELFKKLSVSSSVLMTLGGVMLVNSRPFEGIVMMLPSLLTLLIWLIRDRENMFSKKMTRLVVPGVIIAAAALSVMCFQFYRVTGNPFKMPYAAHQEQYFATPLFSFQPVNNDAKRGSQRSNLIYKHYTKPPVLEKMFVYGLPDSTFLRSVYGFVYLNFSIPVFLLSPILFGVFCFSIPFAIKNNRWHLLILTSIIFTFVCMSFAIWWDQYHYAAPLTCCFFLFLTEGFRRYYETGKKNARSVTFAFSVLLLGSFVLLNNYSFNPITMLADFSAERESINHSLSSNTSVKFKTLERATFFKHELEKIIEKSPDRFIVLVSYTDDYDFHDEIVYNRADIANAKLIWAHDLGAEKNKRLLEYYNNRKALRVNLAAQTIEFEPLTK